MLSKKLAAALAAISLLAGSTAALGQSAAPLSLSAAPAALRAGAPTQDGSELRGGYGWILAIGALGILIFVITQMSEDNALPESA